MPGRPTDTNGVFRGARRPPGPSTRQPVARKSTAPREIFRLLLAAAAAAGLGIGLAAQLAGHAGSARWIWIVGTLPVLAALLGEIVTGLRRGNFGLDIVAALSMSAALVVGQELAAAVVAVMYSGGQFLELFAERRARREMTALLEHVPRTTMRHHAGGLEEIPLESVAPGDRLLIRPGEVVPVDGAVSESGATLDESTLTGESIPVGHAVGQAIMSGPVNVGDAFEMIAERPASASTFAGIVRLVEEAQRSKAPMARLADRYAMWFLGLTVAIAGGAWALSGDPVRGVAVLVVATPCPLILAVPVALVAGLSKAAKEGILIKGAKTLEMMARISVVVFDKTGTLTAGRPGLVAIHPVDGFEAEDLLRLAASIDQASKHSIAQALVAEAHARGEVLLVPGHVTETSGEGAAGMVGGRWIVVGSRGYVADRLGLAPMPLTASGAGSVTVAVGIDGRLAGELVLADALREDAGRLLSDLRRFGIERIVLATGDRVDVAAAVARSLPLDAVRAELTPDQKVMAVLAERKHGPVMMIGDGVNDAPALAAADVGVAMGTRGVAAAAEAADAVLLVDRVDRILRGLMIARRTRRIALESVAAGIGLSVIGMLAAAFGYITPIQGALFQEVIDVAVILNALRALRGG